MAGGMICDPIIETGKKMALYYSGIHADKYDIYNREYMGMYEILRERNNGRKSETRVENKMKKLNKRQ